MIAMAGELAYATVQALIGDQLLAIRRRAQAAASQLEEWSTHGVMPTGWPAELVEDERRIAARVAASAGRFAIGALFEQFALEPGEQRVLWILIGHELCPVVRDLLCGLSSAQVVDPTTDVLRRIAHGLFEAPGSLVELDPGSTLRRFGLVERADDGEVAEHRQTWKVGGRVLRLVRGDLSVDPELAELATRATPRASRDPLVLPPGAAAAIDAAFDQGDVVIVHGRVGSGRSSALLAAADGRGHAVLEIDGRSIAKDREDARRQLRRIARECRLLQVVPLIRDLDALVAVGEAPDRIDLVERELAGLVLATASRAIARRWTRRPIAIELAPLTAAATAELWHRALPQAGPGDAHLLATTYPLAPSLIDAVGRLAVQRCGDAAMTPDHIEGALRAVLDDRLAGLARRVEVTQTWDDIVLPDEQTTAMVELAARIRCRARVYEDWGFANKLGRGLGVTALFSGPPGTGKTMAAGLLAREVGLELYQVDVSKITSKWIGETEKNLAALFDAAEAGHAVLLFDEADALFGKRTEVRSSNDRHANQEVNFLLQRLESFAGICILTTNHDAAIDDAFRRRLAVHVRFPIPDQDERARIWRAMLPAAAPRDEELGLEALASTYVMTGGYIRNAVLRAAFLAADEDGAIDADRLSRAAQLEYEALGKLAPGR